MLPLDTPNGPEKAVPVYICLPEKVINPPKETIDFFILPVFFSIICHLTKHLFYTVSLNVYLK